MVYNSIDYVAKIKIIDAKSLLVLNTRMKKISKN